MTRLGPIKRPVEVSQNVLCFASSNTAFTLYDCWTTVCRSVHTTQLLHRQLDKLSHVVLTLCDGLSNSFSRLNSRLIIQLCYELSINLNLRPRYGQHATANSMQYVEESRKRGLSQSILFWPELPNLSHYYRCKPDWRMHAYYTAGARQFAANRKVARNFVTGASPQNDFSAFARRPRFL